MTRLSREWEIKLVRLYDLGVRRLKRAKGTSTPHRELNQWDREWNKRLFDLIEHHRRRLCGNDDLFHRKLSNLVSGWNIWWYKIEGCQPTITQNRKICKTWEERCKYIVAFWRRKNQVTEFNKRLDKIQRLWRDVAKRIKGGITMDKALKNEKITIKDLRDMLVKQDYRCALSGRLLTPQNCSLDHIIPLSKGGMHTPDNAQLVCCEINKVKANLTDEEFIELCRDIVENNKI